MRSSGEALYHLRRQLQRSLLAPLAPSARTSASGLLAHMQGSPMSTQELQQTQSGPSLSGVRPLLASARQPTVSTARNMMDPVTPGLAAAALLAGASGAVVAAALSTNLQDPRPALAVPGLAIASAEAVLPLGLQRYSAAGRTIAFQLQNQAPAATRGAASPTQGTGPAATERQSAPPLLSSTAGASGSSSPRSATAAAAISAAAPAAFREGTAYGVYDAEGKPSSFDALLASLDSYDVVLLGEYHDDPVAHHLQLRVLQHVLQGGSGQGAGEGTGGRGRMPPMGQAPAGAAAEARAQELVWRQRPVPGRPVALSLEMFDRDVQGVMDEFLAGLLTEADLMRDARPWPNYPQDYRPLVLAAKHAGIPVICANAPRRFVSLVGRSGEAALEALPASSRRHIPQLPLRPASQQYAAKIRWTMQRARDSSDSESGDTGSADDGEETAAPLAAASSASAVPAATTDRAATSAPAGGSVINRRARPSGEGSSTSAAIPSSTANGSASSGGVQSGDAARNGGGNRDTGRGGGSGCPYIGLTVRSNFIDAQNLWDATMASSISEALSGLSAGEIVGSHPDSGSGERSAGAPSGLTEEAPDGSTDAGAHDGGEESRRLGPLVVHVCGKFHSEQRLGICEHLAHLAPSARVGLVTFVPSGRGVDVQPELLRKARLHTYGDWLVLTDAKLPRSFESEHPV